MQKMKFLFFGAGVLGSLYAARLHEAGFDVTVVARGQRYRDIVEHGLVLEQFQTGEVTNTQVRVLDSMPVDEAFDVCVVMIQRTQLESALPVLASNPHIPAFVFMNNMVDGPQVLINAVGQERVLLGHVNAGGERNGHRVVYMTGSTMTLGELSGKKTDRLMQITDAFRAAGFPVTISRNMDTWKRYHVAMAVALAGGMYMCGGCNYRMASHRDAIKKTVTGLREGFKSLQALGYPVEPSKMRLILALPDWLVVPMLQKLMNQDLMDIGGARHINNAREEMVQLKDDLYSLIHSSGVRTPVLDELTRYMDPHVKPLYDA